MADIDKIKKSKTLALFGWAMVVFSPLALIGLVYPANEYQAIGTEGAVDCDGPFGVMLFVIPSLIVFVAGFIAFVRSALTNRTVVSIIMAVISASVCLGLIINAVSAAKELNSQAHQEICGRGL